MQTINSGWFIAILLMALMAEIAIFFLLNYNCKKDYKKLLKQAEEMATFFIHNQEIEKWDKGQMVRARNQVPTKYAYLWHKINIPASKIYRRPRKENEKNINYGEFFVQKRKII